MNTNQTVDSLNYTEVIDEMTKRIEQNEYDADAFFNRAVAYKHNDYLLHALSDINNAIRSGDENIEYICTRAMICSEIGKNDAALADYKHAMLINPNDIAPYLGIAEVYFKMKNHLKAITYYDMAIKFDPENREIHRKRSKVFEDMSCDSDHMF